jgi:hypothetical protein
MSRHLKIKAQLNPDKKTATLTWISQTHFGSNFGNSRPVGSNNNSYFDLGCSFNIGVHNLVSHPNNSFRKGQLSYNEIKNRKWLLLPNRKPCGQLTTTILVEDWPWIKKLVESYNEFYK